MPGLPNGSAAICRGVKFVAGTSASMVILTACGGGGQQHAGVITPPATAALPSAGVVTGAASEPAVAPNQVAIHNFKFLPAVLHVKPGTVVTWTNTDEEPHTVVGGPLRSGVLAGGQATYSFTFTNAGSYSYQCSIHPFMHGSVVVA